VPIPLIPATAIKPTRLDVSSESPDAAQIRPDENNVVGSAIHGMIALVESGRLSRVPAAPSCSARQWWTGLAGEPAVVDRAKSSTVLHAIA